MLSPFEIESMEIITGSVLAAAALGAVLFPTVGVLAYLLTREPAAHAPTVTTVVPGAPAEKQAA